MPELQLTLLGTFEITHADQHISNLTRRKEVALLVYLCLETPGSAQQRDKLAGLLWPDVPQEDARRNLRQCLYQLRRDSRDHDANAAHIVVTAQSITLRAAELVSDVARFRAAVADPARVDEAIALYSGELLPGFNLADAPDFEEWLFYTRDSLQRTYQTLLETQRARLTAAHDWPRLITTLRHILRLDPLNEELQRALMEAYFANGERRAALDQYATCRALLKTELNVEPMPETTTLYTRLKAAEVPLRAVVSIVPAPPTSAPATQSETLTFLFADVEDSTALWVKQPAEMGASLPDLAALVRAAIAAHNGTLFKTVSDAFYATFARPSDAIAAALRIQRAVTTRPWPIAAFTVRTALHTGTAEQRDNDFFGQTLNRLARLLAAGHGGQILLSQATTVLVRDAGLTLRDMGERRLRDLSRPEHIYQVLAPDLPADFPPLRTLDGRPTNLPGQLTAFIGRSREVKTVQFILQRADVRLVTLSGPGGTGKSRLSLEVAAGLRDTFADGVFFVPLAAITDPSLVAPAIVVALGLKEGGASPDAAIAAYLRDKNMLLVLDNFEQVVGAATTVEELLRVAPQLKVLVTSRIVLKIYGEHEYAVPTLPLPDLKRLPSLDQTLEYAAVALFVARAQAVRPDFSLTPDNAMAVIEVCTRLDGLPLAIELVAARSKLFTPQAMVSRLSKRLTLVTGGARSLPERQQTLRGAIRWSYDLLDEAEKKLFAHLSVFAGGCTLPAAEEICGAPGDEGALFDGLLAMVDKSLIRNVTGVDGEPRFVMLETIREFATECFETGDDAASVRGTHAAFFVTLAETAEAGLQSDQQQQWISRIEDDHDNIRAAFQWLVANHDYAQAGRLCGALGEFWLMRSYFDEGRQWTTRILEHSEAIPPASRAKSLRALADMVYYLADFPQATTYYEQSLALYRQLDDRPKVARALRSLALIAVIRADYARGATLLNEALAIFNSLNDGWGIVVAGTTLGMIHYDQGQYDAAHSLFTATAARAARDNNDFRAIYSHIMLARLARARGNFAAARMLAAELLPSSERIGNQNLVGWCYLIQSGAALGMGNFDDAITFAAAARDVWQTLSDTVGVILAMIQQGTIALVQSDNSTAQRLFAETIPMAWSVYDVMCCFEAIEWFALVLARNGDGLRAARLWAAIAHQRGVIGTPIHHADAPLYAAAVAAARAQADPVEWAQAWADGEALDLAQTVRYAITYSAVGDALPVT